MTEYLPHLKLPLYGEPEMTADEMKEIRNRLGLSTTQMGRAVGYDGSSDTASMSIRRYESKGETSRKIPNYMARLLRMYDHHGVPPGWEQSKWRKTPRE